ncbi:MAG: NADH-quinone oxidoreductase subunit C [Planctomycetota bacterium]
MSERQGSAPSLEGLVIESADSDFAADGFHHRHGASVDRVVEIAGMFLEAGYNLEMITCEDRREDLEAMRLVYTFNRFDSDPDRHVVVVGLPPEVPGATAPSVSSVFPAADWLEREVYDMYGVGFTSHPNLKRILLPEDADFHALLRDFGRMEDGES